MSLTTPITEDTARLEVPVTLPDGEFVLREASGLVSTRFVNAKSATYVTSSEGRLIGFKNPGNLMAILVGGCLFKEGNDKPVGDNWVEGNLGHRMKERLFNRALDISGLRETDGDLAALFRELLSSPSIPLNASAIMDAIDAHTEGDTKFGPIRALFTLDSDEESGNS